MTSSIRANIDKNNHPHDLEQSLKIINDASNQMGFASSLERDEKDNLFYIQSKNCILHIVASANQDMICHGLHDIIISKSLEGTSDVRIELKDCMALGNEHCRHIVRSGGAEMKIESENRIVLRCRQTTKDRQDGTS